MEYHTSVFMQDYNTVHIKSTVIQHWFAYSKDFQDIILKQEVSQRSLFLKKIVFQAFS